MKLQDIMIRDVVQAVPDENVGEAAMRMHQRGVGCLVVTVAGAVKGIVTDRDLLECLAQSHDPFRCPVSAHMNRPVIVLGPEEDHVTAAGVLHKRRIKRLPVAKSGKLLGIVSLSDLAAMASTEAEKLRSSLDFFTSIVRAQSSQNNSPSGLGLQRHPASPSAEFMDSGTESDLLDAGGPG